MATGEVPADELVEKLSAKYAKLKEIEKKLTGSDAAIIPSVQTKVPLSKDSAQSTVITLQDSIAKTEEKLSVAAASQEQFEQNVASLQKAIKTAQSAPAMDEPDEVPVARKDTQRAIVASVHESGVSNVQSAKSEFTPSSRIPSEVNAREFHEFQKKEERILDTKQSSQSSKVLEQPKIQTKLESKPIARPDAFNPQSIRTLFEKVRAEKQDQTTIATSLRDVDKEIRRAHAQEKVLAKKQQLYESLLAQVHKKQRMLQTKEKELDSTKSASGKNASLLAQKVAQAQKLLEKRQSQLDEVLQLKKAQAHALQQLKLHQSKLQKLSSEFEEKISFAAKKEQRLLEQERTLREQQLQVRDEQSSAQALHSSYKEQQSALNKDAQRIEKDKRSLVLTQALVGEKDSLTTIRKQEVDLQGVLLVQKQRAFDESQKVLQAQFAHIAKETAGLAKEKSNVAKQKLSMDTAQDTQKISKDFSLHIHSLIQTSKKQLGASLMLLKSQSEELVKTFNQELTTAQSSVTKSLQQKRELDKRVLSLTQKHTALMDELHEKSNRLQMLESDLVHLATSAKKLAIAKKQGDKSIFNTQVRALLEKSVDLVAREKNYEKKQADLTKAYSQLHEKYSEFTQKNQELSRREKAYLQKQHSLAQKEKVLESSLKAASVFADDAQKTKVQLELDKKRQNSFEKSLKEKQHVLDTSLSQLSSQSKELFAQSISSARQSLHSKENLLEKTYSERFVSLANKEKDLAKLSALLQEKEQQLQVQKKDVTNQKRVLDEKYAQLERQQKQIDFSRKLAQDAQVRNSSQIHESAKLVQVREQKVAQTQKRLERMSLALEARAEELHALDKTISTKNAMLSQLRKSEQFMVKELEHLRDAVVGEYARASQLVKEQHSRVVSYDANSAKLKGEKQALLALSQSLKLQENRLASRFTLLGKKEEIVHKKLSELEEKRRALDAETFSHANLVNETKATSKRLASLQQSVERARRELDEKYAQIHKVEITLSQEKQSVLDERKSLKVAIERAQKKQEELDTRAQTLENEYTQKFNEVSKKFEQKSVAYQAKIHALHQLEVEYVAKAAALDEKEKALTHTEHHLIQKEREVEKQQTILADEKANALKDFEAKSDLLAKNARAHALELSKDLAMLDKRSEEIVQKERLLTSRETSFSSLMRSQNGKAEKQLATLNRAQKQLEFDKMSLQKDRANFEEKCKQFDMNVVSYKQKTATMLRAQEQLNRQQKEIPHLRQIVLTERALLNKRLEEARDLEAHISIRIREVEQRYLKQQNALRAEIASYKQKCAQLHLNSRKDTAARESYEKVVRESKHKLDLMHERVLETSAQLEEKQTLCANQSKQLNAFERELAKKVSDNSRLLKTQMLQAEQHKLEVETLAQQLRVAKQAGQDAFSQAQKQLESKREHVLSQIASEKSALDKRLQELLKKEEVVESRATALNRVKEQTASMARSVVAQHAGVEKERADLLKLKSSVQLTISQLVQKQAQILEQESQKKIGEE